MSDPVPPCVVIWDGSVESETALAWGLEHARRSGAAVVLTRVVEPDELDGPECQRALEGLGDRVSELRRSHPDLAVMSDIVGGEPSVVLRRLVARAGVTLVLGTSEDSDQDAVFASSIGAQVASVARGAVVIVPECGPRSFGTVVGIDGSVAALAAAEAAAAECEKTNQRLHLVHVWQDPKLASGRWVDSTYSFWSSAAHSKVLEDASAHVMDRHPGVATLKHLIRGDAVGVLQRFARDATSMFLGAPRFGDWPDQVLGPVASELVVSATCPLILIPAPLPGHAASGTASSPTGVPSWA